MPERAHMLVKDLMTASVSTLRPDDSILNAIKIMRSENVGTIPVCDIQNHVLGIITDRDIILRLPVNHSKSVLQNTSSSEAENSYVKVRDLMSTEIICTDSKDDVHDAALLMAKHAVRRLPVLENEKLVGILSLKDLAKKRIFIAEIGHIIYELSKDG